MKDLIIDYKEGMTIEPPCIVRGMPLEVYHSVEGLSNSGMKLLLDCPAKYYYKYLSGEYEPKEKPAFKIGKACHKYILEGEEAFYAQYWHNPYSELKKEELVEILKNFGYDNSISKFLIKDLQQMLLDNDGIEQKEIHLNKTELNQVVGTARAIKQNKYAKGAFSAAGESELSIFWKDEETGVTLKCRPDFLPYDCLLVPDYKTCCSVKPEKFYKDFTDYGYHIQGAMYRMGIKAVTGVDVETFFYIAQEKEPPFITQVYAPDEMLINFGEKGMRKAIKIYCECKETCVWPAYSDRIIELSTQEKPDELAGDYDKDNAIAYMPRYMDSIFSNY